MAIARRSRRSFRLGRRTRRFAGTAAAATLGYIGGGARGASLAGNLAWRGLGGSSRVAGRRMMSGPMVGRAQVVLPRRKRRTGRSRRTGAISFSRAWTSRRRYKLPRSVRRMLGDRTIRSITSDRIQLLQGGRQEFVDIHLFSNGGSNVPYAMGQSDVAEMWRNLQADVAAGTPASITQKFAIDRIRIESRFKNMTNVPIEMRLYDIVSRRDDEGTISLPTTQWSLGYANQDDPTIPGITSASFPGAEPFESKLFTQTFKVLKKTTVHLQAGSEHKHIIFGRPPQIMDIELVNRFTVVGRRTRFLMCVIEGGVTNNAGQIDPVVIPGVNYSRFAVDVVTEYSAKFHGLEKSRTITTHYSNLPNLNGVERTITEDTDLPTDVVIA